jgi:hypothetical protein
LAVGVGTEDAAIPILGFNWRPQLSFATVRASNNDVKAKRRSTKVAGPREEIPGEDRPALAKIVQLFDKFEREH